MTWTLPMAGSADRAAVATALRQGLTAHAVGQGLSRARCEDLVLAVHEGVANAVEHGGGFGRLRLWRADRLLCCEISDHGAGIPARHQEQTSMPGRTGVRGRGLWLMARLSDMLTLSTGPAGTTVVVVIRLTSDLHL
ncbi:ATP-binding protein [Nonomuraea sp. B12E4]|uniref:ATP-binding protein n=1 Tax=Nonomuraea sp. B12E4 TaxID=3153564 RepID=UPI00325EEA30